MTLELPYSLNELLPLSLPPDGVSFILTTKPLVVLLHQSHGGLKMFLRRLIVVLTIQCLSVLFLEFLIFTFHQLKLVLLGFQPIPDFVKLHLNCLQLLEIDVSLFTDDSMLLLKLFIFLLLLEKFPLPL